MLFARVDKDGRKGGGGLRSRKTIKKDMGRGRIVFVIAGGIFRKLFSSSLCGPLTALRDDLAQARRIGSTQICKDDAAKNSWKKKWRMARHSRTSSPPIH
jgi:hypothetical protein